MRTETETVKSNGESLTIRSLLQPSVNGVAVSLLVSWLTVDILSTFCGVFMIQRVKLMLYVNITELRRKTIVVVY